MSVLQRWRRRTARHTAPQAAPVPAPIAGDSALAAAERAYRLVVQVRRSCGRSTEGRPVDVAEAGDAATEAIELLKTAAALLGQEEQARAELAALSSPEDMEEM